MDPQINPARVLKARPTGCEGENDGAECRLQLFLLLDHVAGLHDRGSFQRMPSSSSGTPCLSREGEAPRQCPRSRVCGEDLLPQLLESPGAETRPVTQCRVPERRRGGSSGSPYMRDSMLSHDQARPRASSGNSTTSRPGRSRRLSLMAKAKSCPASLAPNLSGRHISCGCLLLMVQGADEYGSYSEDHQYSAGLRDVLAAHAPRGKPVPTAAVGALDLSMAIPGAVSLPVTNTSRTCASLASTIPLALDVGGLSKRRDTTAARLEQMGNPAWALDFIVGVTNAIDLCINSTMEPGSASASEPPENRQGGPLDKPRLWCVAGERPHPTPLLRAPKGHSA